tara:strand:- start:1363 stop:2301 length:939 start_codon:yes stop_codon:yes gene_type:complete
MISSFFNKTKPINYIILLTFIFVLYWVVHFFVFDKTYTPEQMLWQILILGVLLFGFFIVNFIVKRNKVADSNSYTILFFALLYLVFPEAMLDNNIIICNFFLLLGFRRLISIRSLKNIKSKIFDATLWIVVSSIFYDWAILFLLLVFMAIYMYEPKNFRNWLVPFTAIFAVAMIAYTVLILANQTEFVLEHYKFSYSFDNDYLLKWGKSAKLFLYVISISIVGLLSFLKLGKAGMGKVATMRLIAVSFLLGLLMLMLAPTNNVYIIMVTFFPASVFLTKYIESINRPNIKEIVLMLTIFIPFMVFFAGLILK